MPSIEMIPDYACTGCGACTNICPRQCIRLQLDSEGFLMPVVDPTLCSECGICLTVCPSYDGNLPSCNSPVTQGTKVFSARNNSRDVLMKSTSGGIFPALAAEVIHRDGIVVGAELQRDLSVKHIAIDNEEGIAKLQGSKYLQSHMGQTYSAVEQYLNEDRPVLFSGLPCQIAGLNSYLQNRRSTGRENLITCQLICYGVPSEAVFAGYVADLEKRYRSRVIHYRFRAKPLGWKTYGVLVDFENGRLHSSAGADDPFIIGFREALYLRRSCHLCRHKGFPIRADIALGDFWGVDEYDTSLSETDGISLVVIQTEQGNNLFDSVKDRVTSKQQTLEMAVSCNPSLVSCPRLTPKRKAYLYDFEAKGFEYCANKHTPASTFRRRAIRSLKRRLHNLLGTRA